MNYSWVKPYINTDKVRVIFEVGSCDCLDAIYLSFQYKGAKVVAFEPNPDSYDICMKTIAEYEMEPYVQLVSKAVSNVNGTVEFWKCDTEVCENIGISSLFKLDFSKRIDETERNIGTLQKRIEVESIRLDSFISETGIYPDMLCMDIQEGELLALEGLGDALEKVEYIVLEVSLQGTYKGGCTFYDIYSFLKKKGFEYVYSTEFSEKLPPLEVPVDGFVFFDCLFQNTRKRGV